MWNLGGGGGGGDIQSSRERGYEQPAPVTHSAKIEYAHTHLANFCYLCLIH